jgi:hypothetical protein
MSMNVSIASIRMSTFLRPGLREIFCVCPAMVMVLLTSFLERGAAGGRATGMSKGLKIT